MYESNKPAYVCGLQGQEIETETYLKPTAKLPDWLNGSLIRLAPAKYQVGNDLLQHWFDGLAMLYKFQFAGDKINYKNRFLKSNAYNDAVKNNCLNSREFATNPKENFLEKIINGLSGKLTDNTNVNVGELSGQYLAMTETAHINVFDPITLERQELYKFADNLKGHLSTAHPHYDSYKDCLINLLTELGPKSSYQIYQVGTKSRQASRNLIAKITTDRPAYIHSFAITQKYIILFELPLRLNFASLLLSGKPYIENYSWQKDLATNVFVVDRSNGNVIKIETEPCFLFHCVNAYDVDNNIVVDFLRYDDSSIVNELYIDQLKAGRALPEAKLSRLYINLSVKSARLEKLFDMSLELPQINYGLTNGKKYNYVYSAGTTNTKDFLNCLVKYDLSKANSMIWQEEKCYPGEPVFVSQPDANSEDEGILLSIVLDAKDKNSFLLILDAKSFTEISRAYLPNIMPFGFHGRYFHGGKGI